MAYSKRGSKYFVAVADLADLRARGEEIEGTADFIVISGVVKKKKAVKTPTGESGLEQETPGDGQL